MKKTLLFVLLTLSLFVLAACGGTTDTAEDNAPPVVENANNTNESAPANEAEPTNEDEPVQEEVMEDKPSITEIAAADGRFTTLVTALEDTGLDATLSEPGDYTVFAPTDDAFNALEEGLLASLQADTALLEDVLLYHVVDGAVSAETALTMDTENVITMNDKAFYVSVVDGSLFVNGALVITQDIEASNGVIHVIDKVLLPPEGDRLTITDILIADGRFTTLLTMMQSVGADQFLAGEGEFTLFAPDDEAFEKLGQQQVDLLLSRPEVLGLMISLHILEGAVTSETAMTMDGQTVSVVDTVQTVTITVRNGDLFVKESRVITTDIEAENGVIHVIDTVMSP